MPGPNFLYDGNYDLYMLKKYEYGNDIDEKDEPEVDRLASIGLMKKGVERSCTTVTTRLGNGQ